MSTHFLQTQDEGWGWSPRAYGQTKGEETYLIHPSIPGLEAKWKLSKYLLSWTECHHGLFFFFNFYLLFIYYVYFWLCWVFVSVRGLSLVAASGSHSSSWCAGLSLSRPLLLRSTGSRHAGSVVVAHGPSCSAACGIFPDQGSNPCPLHWQADSQPLRHQGSPSSWFGRKWNIQIKVS